MHDHEDVETSSTDRGFTLVELLIVIVILGILATVTVFAVRGITDRGQTSACNTDKVTLQTSVESYFAQYGTGTGTASIATATYAAGNGSAVAALVTAIPAVTTAVPVPATTPAVTWVAGATPMASLVKAGYLRAATTNFFVRSDGQLVTLTATCGTVGALS